MDGRRRVALPDKPLRKTVGGKEAITDIKKSELACAVYAEVSRVKIKREDSKAAYGVIFGHIKQNASPDAAVPFTEAELSAVFRRSKGKAAGLDEVLPDQLHHLPPCGRSALLDLLNRAWSEVRIPASWKTALIVPIPKKNKDLTLARSFRPISLLSVVGKVLESLMKCRLLHWATQWVQQFPKNKLAFNPAVLLRTALLAWRS